jgi:hypothetical protein
MLTRLLTFLMSYVLGKMPQPALIYPRRNGLKRPLR